MPLVTSSLKGFGMMFRSAAVVADGLFVFFMPSALLSDGFAISIKQTKTKSNQAVFIRVAQKEISNCAFKIGKKNKAFATSG